MDIARYAWNDNFAEPDVESGSDDGKFRGEGSLTGDRRGSLTGAGVLLGWRGQGHNRAMIARLNARCFLGLVGGV